MSSLERLAHIEATEFAAINLLSHPDLKAERRPEVVKMLGRLRTEKQRILAQDETLLRKSSPASAPSAVPAPAEPAARRIFESQFHANMRLMHNSSAGLRHFDIPGNGKIDLAGGDHEGRQFLMSRGFRDCGQMVEDCGKASAAVLDQFRTSRLQRLTGLPFTGGKLR